jgi:ABC-type transport system involved in Fe-S cluster assembly fused permease/ATPase subunit
MCLQDTVAIVLFNVLPQMIDIVVACAYLAGKMEPWVALIVLVTVSSYIPLTVCITERRGRVRQRHSLNITSLKCCQCFEVGDLQGFSRG